MEYLGLNATAFSGEIGVQRSSISHILSGRNRPGFDFLAKTSSRFPQVNTEWLLTGKGSMVKDSEPVRKTSGIQQELFDDGLKNNEEEVLKSKIRQSQKNNTEKIKFTNVNTIERVIIFYTNGTFSDYHPKWNENIDN